MEDILLKTIEKLSVYNLNMLDLFAEEFA